MKKILALMLALAMVFALAACGSSTQEAAEEDTTEAAEAPAEEAAEEPAEEAAEEPAEEAGDDTVYTIGIIQLVEHVALDAASQGFMDALTEKLGEDHVVFDYQNAQGESANCATIANSLVSEDVDLILAVATASLQAASSATGTIPVLGTAVTDYATALSIPAEDWTGTVGTNVSGTSDLAPLDQQAEMMAEMFPIDQYPTVGILYCSAEPNSVYQYDVMNENLTALGYTVESYTFADTNDIASVTQNACDNVDVIYVPTDNTAANAVDTINSVVEPAGIPVYSSEEGICIGCGVATLTISYYDLGYATGEMAYEILVNGADVSTMPIEYAPSTTPEYVASRAETFGITPGDDWVAIGDE